MQKKIMGVALSGLFILIIIAATSTFAAANTIPVTGIENWNTAITLNDLKPTICNGITIGGLNELLLGTANGDTLSGGDGNDCILGGAGSDWLSGNAGNDVIDGGAGFDFCFGGTGTNTVLNCEISW